MQSNHGHGEFGGWVGLRRGEANGFHCGHFGEKGSAVSSAPPEHQSVVCRVSLTGSTQRWRQRQQLQQRECRRSGARTEGPPFREEPSRAGGEVQGQAAP